MDVMNAFDSQAEDSPTSLGRSLRRRPLARKKLSEMVEEELEQMIRRHEFGEGEQLPSERELMAFFNVGRPSVREALAALKRKGLVQINNGERARVSRPSADTIISELSGMAKDFLTHPGEWHQQSQYAVDNSRYYVHAAHDRERLGERRLASPAEQHE